MTDDEVIDWLLAGDPGIRWQTLRDLDHLRDAGRPGDPRLAEALDLVRSRCGTDGRWVAENPPPEEEIGEVEPSGAPSRMITLRALRVLRHFDAA